MTLPAHLNDVTPRSATTLVVQCQVHIDNELAALAESMRALRSRRNRFARVSCLPTEILATVFKHIEESSQSYPNNCHRPICVTVTHVCRHWRRVALECPRLWAFIGTSTSARWMGIMLERSKKAALVVSCNATTLPRDSLEQVLSHLPRIKVLRLHSYPSDVDRILDHLLSQPAPLLQEFKFTVFSGRFRQTFKPMSDDIFQRRTPQLWSLELTNCRFSWTSCIFSGLRTLCVRGVRSSTLPELLPALVRMPGLERLALEQLSIISGGSNAFFDRVPLVRLKSIVLSGTIQTAVALFAHLALPDNIEIALNLSKIEGPQSLSDLFSAINKSPGKFGPVFRSLRATFSSLISVVQFSTSIKHKHPSSWNASDDDVPFSIQFQSDSPVAVQPSILFDICQMVTQGTIRTLSLSSSNDLDEFWRAGSAHFPELEEIHTSRSIEGLFAALEIVDTQNADIAYRSLRVLDLENIDFIQGYPDYIHDIIAVRNGHHCGSLRHLRLAECRGLTVNDVQLLGDVIEEIDWDGLEEALESESDSGFGSCRCPECSEYD